MNLHDYLHEQRQHLEESQQRAQQLLDLNKRLLDELARVESYIVNRRRPG